MFLDFLQTIVRTKENIEKKHALTYDEIVQEREEVSFSHCKLGLIGVGDHSLYVCVLYFKGKEKQASCTGKHCKR